MCSFQFTVVQLYETYQEERHPSNLEISKYYVSVSGMASYSRLLIIWLVYYLYLSSFEELTINNEKTVIAHWLVEKCEKL